MSNLAYRLFLQILPWSEIRIARMHDVMGDRSEHLIDDGLVATDRSELLLVTDQDVCLSAYLLHRLAHVVASAQLMNRGAVGQQDGSPVGISLAKHIDTLGGLIGSPGSGLLGGLFRLRHGRLRPDGVLPLGPGLKRPSAHRRGRARLCHDA